MFVEVVGLAREMGLASFVKLSINGTKVRANGSKHKAMSYERTGLAKDPTLSESAQTASARPSENSGSAERRSPCD